MSVIKILCQKRFLCVSVEMKVDLDDAGGHDDLPPGECVVPDGGSGRVRRKFDARCHEWKCRLRPEDFCDLWIGVRGKS